MARRDGETTIKKYANRRLYNTGTSSYVTLDDLARMVRNGEDFRVQDARTAEDITHSVLTQIVMEQEARSSNTLLPVPFLRQLIGCYGEQIQTVVPGFLEHSMKALSEQQSQIREQMNRAASADQPQTRGIHVPAHIVEEQVRRNTELFNNAMQMFSPYNGRNGRRESVREDMAGIAEIRAQLKTLQDRLDSIQQ